MCRSASDVAFGRRGRESDGQQELRSLRIVPTGTVRATPTPGDLDTVQGRTCFTCASNAPETAPGRPGRLGLPHAGRRSDFFVAMLQRWL
jgi:hypothetical protein